VNAPLSGAVSGDPAGISSGRPPFLGLRAIRHAFGRTRVLDGVDLDVRGGEFVSLLGPSGCGKTTLLRIVAGLEALQEGGVELDGRNLANLPTEKRSLGMVFQSYALFPNLDVRGNVAYGLRSRSTPREEALRRVAAMLDRVGLTGLERRHPAELSGGQQQRVALARALVVSPRLLLLDEPFSALDAKVREETRLLVRALQRETGVSAILVTHDQEEALTISDRIALMQGGRLVQVDAPRDIYRRPSTPFAAGFLGTANRFTGREASLLDPTTPGSDDVEAVVRPEDLVVADDGIAATVGDLEFRGSVLRLVARAMDDRIWFCDIDARDEHQYAVGQAIRLGARPGAVLRFRGGALLP
jgi:putative spermidine/putrescine transport system ATP-binding protein